MGFFFGVVIFCFGLLIGSFLNVCIYRIPNNKSIVSPPSSCTSCDTRIKWYDLIPVISYLLLKGKCRNCGQKISPRYMLIELLTGTLFLVCFLVFGLTSQLVAFIVLTGLLIAVTFTDLDTMTIPDSIMIFGLIAGIVFVLLGYVPQIDMTLKQRAIAGALGLLSGAGPLIVINLLTLLVIKKAGIGGGDIKLMGVVGIFLGVEKTLFALVFGVIIAGVFSVFALRKKRMQEANENDGEQTGLKLHEIPFGPYLAVASFVSMLYGSQIVDWYFSLY